MWESSKYLWVNEKGIFQKMDGIEAYVGTER